MPWTDLTYPFGSLLTSTKMTQNQDNFHAVANADSGAPRISTTALRGGDWPTVDSGGNLINGYSIPNVGDGVPLGALGVSSKDWTLVQLSSNSTTDAWVTKRAGRLAFSFNDAKYSGTGVGAVRMYRNGVAWTDVTTLTTANSGFIVGAPPKIFYLDSLDVGDNLQLYFRLTGTASYTLSVFRWIDGPSLTTPIEGGG